MADKNQHTPQAANVPAPPDTGQAGAGQTGTPYTGQTETPYDAGQEQHLPPATHWRDAGDWHDLPDGGAALFPDCPSTVVNRLRFADVVVGEPDATELIVAVLQLQYRGLFAMRAIRRTVEKLRDGSLDLHLARLGDRGGRFVSWAYCAAQDSDGFEQLVDRLAVRVLGRGPGADASYVRLWNDYLRLTRRYARSRLDADRMAMIVAGQLFHARAAELFRVVDRMEANLAQEKHLRAEAALAVFDEDFGYAVSLLADVPREQVDRSLIELQRMTYLVDYLACGFDDNDDDFQRLLVFVHTSEHTQAESA